MINQLINLKKFFFESAFKILFAKKMSVSLSKLSYLEPDKIISRTEKIILLLIFVFCLKDIFKVVFLNSTLISRLSKGLAHFQELCTSCENAATLLT